MSSKSKKQKLTHLKNTKLDDPDFLNVVYSYYCEASFENLM